MSSHAQQVWLAAHLLQARAKVCIWLGIMLNIQRSFYTLAGQCPGWNAIQELDHSSLWQMQAKPDAIAYSELKDQLTPQEVHGQIPGVRVGQVFQNRGELAILGLHCVIFQGIYAK